MPIRIPQTLPAMKVLEAENIFVMAHERAVTQDIRPLRIAILNLMPTKIETETQLLRLLSNTPLQVDVDLLHMASHLSKNTPAPHLAPFYKTVEEIAGERYDGMIVTGAPVEKLPYEEVDYWPELCRIWEWSRTHVHSLLTICWGAQAALYYFFGIQKHLLPQKLSGVYSHRVLDPLHPLTRGFDDRYFAPHSRYTEVRREDLEANPALEVLTYSAQAGVHLAANRYGRQFFVMGHAEYDRETLANEYFRDVNKGLRPQVAANYFPDNDVYSRPMVLWKGHASLLFSNWLNYFVYQTTPYDLSSLA